MQDDTFHVRVCDFGFSRVKEREASRGLTKSYLGPIKWTSPEAMRQKSYSIPSDVFSFGVVLYEIFVQVRVV
jgi:serine/threonine protein kinase